MVFVILDNQLGKFIEFHDVMHCFRDNCGKGIDFLEVYILQQLVAMR